MENKRAADYRRIARGALTGAWGLCLAVTLVAVIMGGMNHGGASVTITFDAQDLSTLWSRNGFNLAALLSRFGLSDAVAQFATAAASIGSMLAIIQLVLGGAVELGHNRFYMMRIRGEDPKFPVLFSRFEIFGRAIGLSLFMTLFIVLWSMLLVIPGIIASYRYRMAPYLMAENPGMGIREAVNESKRRTEGFKWRWFCLDFSFIGWDLLCCLTLGIGFLWLNPYIAAANAAFFLDIMGGTQNGAGTGGNTAEPEFEYSGPDGTQRL